MIDPRLEEFATDTQRKYLEATNRLGSSRNAAIELGVHHSAVSRCLLALNRRAALAGYAPGHFASGVAPGFAMGKVTVQRSKEGEVERTWERQSPDNNRREEILREFVQELCKDVKPLPPISGRTFSSDADLLAVYPMGDPHFGMYAWAQDAGANFDIDIAEKMTNGAIDRLVSSAPPAKEALLLNLGDMFHADNQRNVTTSGHQLDVDGRWKKTLQVGLRSMVYAVRRLLERHERVIFRINGGNHDGHSSYALALMMDCYFHLEPRVEVDLSPSVCWYHQFGNVLIGSTHGDTIKGADLVAVMAADQAEAWGQTSHRYWYVGHVHHQDVKEHRGGVVEYFRTLAARDAWHQGQGYRAGRDMRLIVLHREHGEIERHRCDVAMVS